MAGCKTHGFKALLKARRQRPPEEEELGQTQFVIMPTTGGVAQKAVELLLKETTREATALTSSLLLIAVNGLGKFLAAVEALLALTLAFLFPHSQIHSLMCCIGSFPECTLEHFLEHFLKLCILKYTHKYTFEYNLEKFLEYCLALKFPE